MVPLGLGALSQKPQPQLTRKPDGYAGSGREADDPPQEEGRGFGFIVQGSGF